MKPGVEEPQEWADVVYGRTVDADFWWRAVPSWTGRRGWLEAVVRAALGGGQGLGEQPRLVLARGDAGTLVGVACRARLLSETMHTDGQRPLFCFVGWLHAPSGVPAAVPSIDALEAQFTDWAASTYERWMTPAWEEHPSRLREPAQSEPRRAPWTATPEIATAGLSGPRPGWARLHPADRRGELWSAAAAGSAPIVLVTGWRAHRDGLSEIVTDLCADDVGPDTPDAVQITRPKPVAPPAPQVPSSVEPPPTDDATVAQQPSPRERFRRFPSSGLPPSGRPMGRRFPRKPRRTFETPPDHLRPPDTTTPDTAAADASIPPAPTHPHVGYRELIGRRELVTPADAPDDEGDTFDEFD